MFTSRKKKQQPESAVDSEENKITSPQNSETSPADEKSDPTETPDNADKIKFSLLPDFEKWKAEMELPEDTAEACWLVVSMIDDAINRNSISPELFEIIRRGVEYDYAVEQATTAGELKGRNARIEELMEEEGDGVPHPTGGSGTFNRTRTPSIFDLAKECRTWR